MSVDKYYVYAAMFWLIKYSLVSTIVVCVLAIAESQLTERQRGGDD